MGYSYSKISTYERCPAKYNYRYNLKIKMPPVVSKGMDRGLEIHQQIEDYLLGKRPTIPEEYIKFYGQFFLSLRETEGKLIEEEWAVDRQWKRTTFDAPDHFLRGLFDLRIGHTVYEWKTGKVYPEHSHQRQLYGIALLCQLEELEEVRIVTVYLDKKKNSETVAYSRATLPLAQAEWMSKVERIESDEVWLKQPQFMCRYCEYSRFNNGPCQF